VISAKKGASMNRKQFGLTILLALIAGLIGGMVSTHLFTDQNLYLVKSTKPQKVFEAEEFHVVDKNGEILAKFGMSNIYYSPAVELRMFTQGYRKKSGILMVAKESGSVINIYGNDRNNNIGIEMEVSNSGSASLEVGYGGTDITASLKGETIIEENKSHLELSSRESGSRVQLFDKNGMGRTVLGSLSLETIKTGEVHNRPESSLVLFDKDGKIIWSIP